MEGISIICLVIACAGVIVWNNWPGERPPEPRPDLPNWAFDLTPVHTTEESPIRTGTNNLFIGQPALRGTPTEEALRSIRGTGDNTAVGAWALEQRSGENTTFVGSVRKEP